MRVYNTWREVNLATTLETVIQNLTGLTLLVKLGENEPDSDIDSLYFSGRTRISNSIYGQYDIGTNVWVRVLEPFEDGEILDGKGTRRYITVINDGVQYNGFEIYHGAGLMDFGVINATSVFWELSDGTTSVTERPAKVLPAGKSILYTDFHKEYLELNANDTQSNYSGNLKDLPDIKYKLDLSNCVNVTGDLNSVSSIGYYLNLYGCVNVTGDLSSVSNVSNSLYLDNCSNITGDLSSVSSVSRSLDLSGCPNITGDLSYIPNVSNSLYLTGCVNITGDLSSVSNVSDYLDLSDCVKITGILTPNIYLGTIFLANTGMSPNDTDRTITEIANNTIVTGGILQIKANRTNASNIPFIYLTTIGWTITEI